MADLFKSCLDFRKKEKCPPFLEFVSFLITTTLCKAWKLKKSTDCRLQRSRWLIIERLPKSGNLWNLPWGFLVYCFVYCVQCLWQVFFRYCLIASPQSILPAPYAEPEPSPSPVYSSEPVTEFDSQAAVASPISASTAASSSSEPSPVPPSPPAFSPSPDTTTTARRRTSPLPSVKESKSAVAEAKSC